MTAGSPLTRSQIDVTRWSDVGSRDALELVASSVAEMVGFEIASISVVRGERMFAVAVEGSPEIRAAMLGLGTPLDLVQSELDRADAWGRFRFVPEERLDVEVAAVGWVPDLVPVDGLDAWQALDLLIAPLLDETGQMIGLLSIDLPLNGRRPGPTQRHLLERYVLQAERTLRLAVERDELAERIRLAEAARRVVRYATSQDDLEQALDDCQEPLLEGFRCDFVTIRTFESAVMPAAGKVTISAPDDVVEAVQAAARLCWSMQRVSILTEAETDDAILAPDAARLLVDFARASGLGSAMLVPVGAGHQCLGHVILGRVDPTVQWSPDEQASALDIARDIGQAVINAHNLMREQRLVEELRRLAAYKSQVLSTVSHELKNPLSAISGHVEMLEADPGLVGDARRSVLALDRASRRMARVVDDLLLLAEVEDPDAKGPSIPVDLRPLLDEAVEQTRVSAERRELDVQIAAPEHEVMTCGQPADLDRMLTNLLSNAVKYSPRGGLIVLGLAQHDDEVELAVTDSGIGISTADQARLFTEFFRSTNPQAVAQPGTGLGLTICARIVERHGGRIEVESVLGEGSTFRVFLPAAALPQPTTAG